MGIINYQEVTKLKISTKITTTIGTAAILAMLAVPAMASTTHEAFPAGNGLGIGNDLGDTLLLARSGNGNRGEGKGSSGESGDRDRDRDGSCLESITAPNNTSSIILAGNGNGSGDQDQKRDGSCDDDMVSNGRQTGDQDGDQDRDRDGSCLESITAPNNTSSIILAGNGTGSVDRNQDKDQDRDASCQI
jgi:hypothetical protein